MTMLNQTFERWTVIDKAPSSPAGAKRWLCRCSCGVERIVFGFTLRNGQSKSCGCLLREYNATTPKGEQHPNWKGGRHINKKGYVVIHGKPTRYEHDVVMEQLLGRPLTIGETVHHKNGIRHDNVIDNLELRVSNHPSGQTIPDVVSWAKEILSRYEPESLTCPI